MPTFDFKVRSSITNAMKNKFGLRILLRPLSILQLRKGKQRSAKAGEYTNSQDYSDMTEEERNIIIAVQGYTMTSLERQISLSRIVDYVVANNIKGDLVECGVWRGGCSMIMAQKLLTLNAIRRIWLYDTFDGMTPPDDKYDISYDGQTASSLLQEQYSNKSDSVVWAVGSLEEVKKNIEKTGYSIEYLEFIQGDICQTVPSSHMPSEISVLRLDTDWYSSTLHELHAFYHLVTPGGFIIIDDYGHWEGSKRAVDEFLETLRPRPYLHRIDYTCRVIQKGQ